MMLTAFVLLCGLEIMPPLPENPNVHYENDCLYAQRPGFDNEVACEAFVLNANNQLALSPLARMNPGAYIKDTGCKGQEL